jgi:hypothetical protein
MRCIGCVSTAVSERPERTAQGYRRFRCRGCAERGKQNAFPHSLKENHRMPPPSTQPPRIKLQRSGQKVEIVIEGTVSVFPLGLLLLVYIGHLLH